MAEVLSHPQPEARPPGGAVTQLLPQLAAWLRPASVLPPLLTDICDRYLGELAAEQAAFLSSSPDAQGSASLPQSDLVASGRADLLDLFEASLIRQLSSRGEGAPAAHMQLDKSGRLFWSTAFPRLLIPQWLPLHWPLPRPVELALVRELQSVFLQPLPAPPRRNPLFFVSVVSAVAAAIQQLIIDTPCRLRELHTSQPLGTGIERTLSSVLSEIEDIRRHRMLRGVRPLTVALRELHWQLAEADRFVWLPLNPTVTAPLTRDDFPLYARDGMAAFDLARQVVRAAGVILVSGYRGVGKSSFVNYALLQQVPVLEAGQADQVLNFVVPVQVNLAKATSIESVLRLCIRAVYRDLLTWRRANTYLRKKEEELLTWAYLRASYKVDARKSASLEAVKHVEASMDVKLGSLVPKALGAGPLGALLGIIPLLGPSLAAKWARESRDKFERTIALLDYDEDRAEDDLLRLIELLAEARRGPEGPARIKLAIVFDEMDKMDEQEQEKVINRCKNLFLSRNAVFVLVTSKKFYYEWLKNRGVEDSVLGSYFTSVATVPLFTHQDARRLLERLVMAPQSLSAAEPDQCSPLEDEFLSDLARCLTYRAGGLPREIIRKLDEVQDWLPDGLQPFVSSQSAKALAVKTYADIHEVLEGLPSTIGSRMANAPPEGGDEALWVDQARAEQIMRGLYVLMEELIVAGSLELPKSQRMNAATAVENDDLEPRQKLAQLYADNFTLVSLPQFSELLERLFRRLANLQTSDGSALFELVEAPPEQSDEVKAVLRVTAQLYALTGRAPASPSSPLSAPAAAFDPLAELEVLLAGEAHEGRLADQRAVTLLSQVLPEADDRARQTERLLALLDRYVGQAHKTSWSDAAGAGSVVAGLLSGLERVAQGDILEHVVKSLAPTRQVAEGWGQSLIGLARESRGGGATLLALLAENGFEAVPARMVDDVIAHERDPKSVLDLWGRLLPFRGRDFVRGVLVTVLSRVDKGGPPPVQAVEWLDGADWGPADEQLLLEAATREMSLVPVLMSLADGMGKTQARQRLAPLESRTSNTRKRSAKTSSRLPTPLDQAAGQPLGRVQKVFVWAWPIAMLLLYLALPVDLSADADLSVRFWARGLELLYAVTGFATLVLLILALTDRMFLWYSLGAAFVVAGLVWARVAILDQPLTVAGQGQLLGLLVLAFLLPAIVMSSKRLRGVGRGNTERRERDSASS